MGRWMKDAFVHCRDRSLHGNFFFCPYYMIPVENLIVSVLFQFHLGRNRLLRPVQILPAVFLAIQRAT